MQSRCMIGVFLLILLMHQYMPIKIIYFIYFSGTALKNLGLFEEAISTYDCAIKIFPNNSQIFSNKGKGFISIY